MAKMACLCCILVLAMFAGFGLQSSTANVFGSFTILNKASNNMSLEHEFYYYTTGIDQKITIELPMNKKSVYLVIDDDTWDVETTFVMRTPAGTYVQTVSIWVKESYFTCMPHCFWLVEDNGFSWGNNATSPLTYVVNWIGPSPPSAPIAPKQTRLNI